MHYTDAIEVAQLGANIIIGKDSNIHYTHAMDIVKIIVAQGSHITIEKDYHYTNILEMVAIGGKQITIKI